MSAHQVLGLRVRVVYRKRVLAEFGGQRLASLTRSLGLGAVQDHGCLVGVDNLVESGRHKLLDRVVSRRGVKRGQRVLRAVRRARGRCFPLKIWELRKSNLKLLKFLPERAVKLTTTYPCGGLGCSRRVWP
jgi:hypothetical protein